MRGAAEADPWRVLGVRPGAPWAEVRAAHRRLAKQLHPDRAGGDPERMTAVNIAFAALVAERRRADRSGAAGAPGAAPVKGPGTATGQAGRPPPAGSPAAPQPDPRAAPPPAPSAAAAGADAEAGGAGAATFSIALLPVDAFESLLIVSSFLGDPWVIDEPYQLVVTFDPPFACRALLELAPEAGGSLVTVEVESQAGGPVPDAGAVRDALVTELNRL